MTTLTTPAAGLDELTALRDLATDLHDGLERLVGRLPEQVQQKLRRLCRDVDRLTGTEWRYYTLDDAIRMLAEPAGAGAVGST